MHLLQCVCVCGRYLTHLCVCVCGRYLTDLCVCVCGRYLTHLCVCVCGRYLAHMYMAECLVALDCIADGIDHLNADLITDVSTVFITELKSDQGDDSRVVTVVRPSVHNKFLRL